MSQLSDCSNLSCGILELTRLTRSPKADLLQALHSRQGESELPIWIWSNTNQRLYDYIKKTFGESGLTMSKWARNPNTGNKICVFTWRVNRRKLRAWYKANKPKERPTNYWGY